MNDGSELTAKVRGMTALNEGRYFSVGEIATSSYVRSVDRRQSAERNGNDKSETDAIATKAMG